MQITTYNCYELTGGGTRSLDAISVGVLNDHDRSFVFYGSSFYAYEFDAGSSLAESSPDVIRPDDYVSAGAWILQSVGGNTNPVGSYLDFPTDTPPTGYLECDGSAISRTTYASLFAVLSTDYGVGDGSTTFNLPDWRGYGVRYYDNGALRDIGRADRGDRGDGTTGDAVGTTQDAKTARPSVTAFTTNSDSHTHSYTDYRTERGNSGISGGTVGLLDYDEGATSLSTGSDSHSHSITGGGDDETTMLNRSCIRCIKY